jgi:glycosyltransferase involved in cell wall biosynthesis
MSIGTPTFSVVIPAHDEQQVIAACLGFVGELDPGEAEVVVVANGCSDRTAETAAQVAGVRVVSLAQGGKAGALNAGDRAVTVFPRIYLDADIVLGAPVLRALRDALAGAGDDIAAPRVQFDLSGRPWPVRAFYAAYRTLPYVNDGLVGLGVYALSERGRSRFEQFPTITADDLFVQRLFAPEERTVLPDASFPVATPRTLRDLLAVRTRTAYGNRELRETLTDRAEFAGSTSSTVRELARAVLRGRLAPWSAAVYVLVTTEARRRSRRLAAGTWLRDSSTR